MLLIYTKGSVSSLVMQGIEALGWQTSIPGREGWGLHWAELRQKANSIKGSVGIFQLGVKSSPWSFCQWIAPPSPLTRAFTQLQQGEKAMSILLCAPCRCDSWSNSDRSLEQTSSDDVFIDSLQSQPSLYLVQPSGTMHQDGAPLANPGVVPRSTDMSGTASNLSSSPLLGTPLTPTFPMEQSQSTLPYGVSQLDVLSNTPPPRPPKPTHFSDRRGDEAGGGVLQNGHAGTCHAPVALVPRRISLSSLDNMRNWKGECKTASQRACFKPVCKQCFDLSTSAFSSCPSLCL